ncbi:MAG: tetratricopeptide (TPR) repeat protein [Myxococcota bacterium]|jgi:tetratricopeptide (TPR) repeat protein
MLSCMWSPLSNAAAILCLTVAVSAITTQARACPEVAVPMDFRDTAFQSKAWKKAMTRYKAQKHSSALTLFRKASRKLEKEAAKLFLPADDASAAKNSVIQRWLQKHVYTPHPGVLIHRDRFTYPAQVWLAWADCACRSGAYEETLLGLARAKELQPDVNVTQQLTMTYLRLDRFEDARKQLAKAPPDAFFTPFAQALLAHHDGDATLAKTKLDAATGVADLPARRKAIEAARKQIAP